MMLLLELNKSLKDTTPPEECPERRAFIAKAQFKVMDPTIAIYQRVNSFIVISLFLSLTQPS